jgi:LytS/YehU family sensor histidine kinase
MKIKRMRREQLDLHIEVLKNQLTPHYLFNNLNTISSLLYKDKSQTDKYIRSFVNSCRFIIDNSRNVLITLEQELDFVKSYLYLMEIRFPEMWKIEINVPIPFKKYCLPPLSVQLLVENAIKHNTLSSENILLIKIFVNEKKYLVVENNLTDKIKDTDNKDVNLYSTKIGIQNIKARFAFLTDKQVFIDKKGFFSVRIPLINSNSGIYEAKIA